MLPHLAERPLNLQRFPNGAGAPGLLAEGHPRDRSDLAAALARDRGRGARDGATTTSSPTGSATLCWLGNQAASRSTPGPSRLEQPFAPTFALIDIDPGDEDDLGRDARPRPALPDRARATSASAATRRRPASAGSRSGSRSSRSTRSPRRATGSRGSAGRSARPCPDLVSWEWAKGARGGQGPPRLHPERSRSRRSSRRTAVRPAAGAPVSAPITWDELDDPELRPDRWTIRTIVERVDGGRRPVRGRPDRPAGAAAAQLMACRPARAGRPAPPVRP